MQTGEQRVFETQFGKFWVLERRKGKKSFMFMFIIANVRINFLDHQLFKFKANLDCIMKLRTTAHLEEGVY